MQLKILTPTEEKYYGKVSGFNVTTTTGNITILDNHEPMISMFDRGGAYIIDNENKHHKIELETGFLEMTSDNKLNVLTE